MYPISIDVKRLAVLVVGGGKIATRKVKDLVAAGGRPTIIAPEITEQLAKLIWQRDLEWKNRPYQTGDVKAYHLIFICTNQAVVNQSVAAEIEPYQLVNDTTKPARSNFFNMALIKARDYGLAVTTFGANPRKSVELKKTLQQWLQNNNH